MRIVRNLILLCMLLICQQYIVAQSYNLGKQKQSFAYETLYANRAQVSQVVKNNTEATNTQPSQPLVSANDIQKCEQTHKEIYKKIYEARANLNLKYNKIYNLYKNIYNSSQLINENVVYITKIQTVLINYINTQGKAYPTLEYQLMNAASMEDAIQIFLSYYQE